MEPIWPGWTDPEILKKINEKLQKDSKQREIAIGFEDLSRQQLSCMLS
jgi:hypothetical protein